MGLREGWGLSHNSKNGLLYASDGSNVIFEIDPESWKTLRKIEVKDKQNKYISNLNELEII